jgi:hypothetical protein
MIGNIINWNVRLDEVSLSSDIEWTKLCGKFNVFDLGLFAPGQVSSHEQCSLMFVDFAWEIYSKTIICVS